MTTITKEIQINASVSEVWKVLSDIGNVHKCSPNIVSSHITSAQTSGIGTTRHCDFASLNATVEERVVGWEPEKSITIDIYSLERMPGINSMGAKFDIEERDGGTRLVAKLYYSMKWSAFGAMMNRIMMKPMTRKNWVIFVAGIKRHVETGEIVESNAGLELAMVKS